MKKRKIVLSDKAKIASVIAELDEKKNEALKKAYNQVNKVCTLRALLSSNYNVRYFVIELTLNFNDNYCISGSLIN